MTEWQPIETAPRGTRVLVYGQGGVFVNYVDEVGQLRNLFGRPKHGATHWMPLPAPPAT